MKKKSRKLYALVATLAVVAGTSSVMMSTASGGNEAAPRVVRYTGLKIN